MERLSSLQVWVERHPTTEKLRVHQWALSETGTVLYRAFTLGQEPPAWTQT